MPEIEDQRPADERVHNFLVKYGIRLAAGLALLGGVLAIVLGARGHLLLWLVLLGPLAIGALVPLLGVGGLSNGINGLGSGFSAGADKVRGRTSKFARYAQQPFYNGASAIWRASERIPGNHLRAGLRLAAFAYLIALMGFILYVAIYVMLVIIAICVVLLIVLFAVGNDEQTETGTRPQATIGATGRASSVSGRIVRGTNMMNEEWIGRIAEDGRVFKGTNMMNEEWIGRIAEDGRILKGTNMMNEEWIGRIAEDGRIFKGTNMMNEQLVGRVDSDGHVYAGSGLFSERMVGRIGKE